MKKIRIAFITFVAMSIIVTSGFLTQLGYCRGDLGLREIFTEVHDLRKEINLLNLVNGLYLSPQQMAQMLNITRKVEEIRGGYRSKAVSQARQMEEVLKEIRGTVARDEEIDGELVRKFHGAKKRMEDLKEEFRGSMMPYQDEMKGVLNENQLALIEEFKPCIIPPRDSFDSARIGQAHGDTRIGERFLTRVRQMDERVYQKRKPLIIERHIERVGRHVGLLSEEEMAEEERRISEIFKRARELSDLDFEAQKGDLARELKEPHEKAMKNRHRKRKGDLDKLGKFLLDPELIPILEKRLTKVTVR
ncbi:MAG: hypothetical protein JSW70_08825 [Syntrophobacterales bacterium]|nr:MAG: hypothetical protein JSW70_08825 [Syntrophobacterales bacterium]